MRNLLCIFFLIISFEACTPLSNFLTTISKPTNKQAKRLAVSGEDSKSPFTLAVIDELHDGNRLHVHAILSTKTSWPANAIEVRLIGLSYEDKVAEHAVLLSEMLAAEGADAQTLKANQDYDLVLSIPASQVVGYQLELFWGEGKNVNDTASGSGGAFALELRNLEVDQRLLCNREPCQIGFSLKGLFFNNSNKTLNNARIAVGFIFVPAGKELDLSYMAAEREEQVDLSGINLAGGQSKPFKINIKTLVPERSDGAFVPVVRVLDFAG